MVRKSLSVIFWWKIQEFPHRNLTTNYWVCNFLWDIFSKKILLCYPKVDFLSAILKKVLDWKTFEIYWLFGHLEKKSMVHLIGLKNYRKRLIICQPSWKKVWSAILKKKVWSSHFWSFRKWLIFCQPFFLKKNMVILLWLLTWKNIGLGQVVFNFTYIKKFFPT